MDKAQLADFLRTRREALQPEDVGLGRGSRRRTEGLRREEVAALCGMSVDYYTRLEQRRGPQPSEQMVAAIARGLRLSLEERDHVFWLAGHNAPHRALRSDHVNPALMRILDRLTDTPAQVMSGVGETLLQTQPAVALLGDETHFDGMARSAIYRWFTDRASRRIYPEPDHALFGRVLVSQLRLALSREGPDSRPAMMVSRLLAESAEFRRVWGDHEVGLSLNEVKHIVHPELGVITVNCQALFDLEQSQALLVFTATPGTESYEKLQRLSRMSERRLHAQ
jgi:transcriptional regulator with XRE-family HTH domain